MLEWIQKFFTEGGALGLLKALALLVVGLIVIRVIVSIVRSTTIKNRALDNAASTFVTSLAKVVLYILLAIAVLSVAGVDTASLVAAFAAVALAVSLGLQDTLSGLTNGIVIIFTKPFKQGDYVSIDGTEGTVKEIRLFNTKLTTPDNLDIIVPNSTVLNSELTNYSSMPLRRIDVRLRVAYGQDVAAVKSYVLDYLRTDKRVVKTPEPMCRVIEYGDTSLVFTVRAWVKGEIFWDVKFDLMEGLYTMLKENGVDIPLNKVDVRLVQGKEDKK